MLVNCATLVVLDDAPDGDTERAEEREHRRDERVEDKPAQAFVPRVADRVRDDLVDVDVGRALLVATEPAGQDEAKKGKTLVWRGEDPGLEGATRRREAGRPAPNDLVQLVKEDHDEGDLEHAVEIRQARGEDEDLHAK